MAQRRVSLSGGAPGGGMSGRGGGMSGRGRAGMMMQRRVSLSGAGASSTAPTDAVAPTARPKPSRRVSISTTSEARSRAEGKCANVQMRKCANVPLD
jgi:hypothetical protein